MSRLARSRRAVVALRRTTAHRGLAAIAIGAGAAVATVRPARAALPLPATSSRERLLLLIAADHLGAPSLLPKRIAADPQPYQQCDPSDNDQRTQATTRRAQ